MIMTFIIIMFIIIIIIKKNRKVHCIADVVVLSLWSSFTILPNRLVGLVVKASISGAEDPVFESRLGRDFSGSSHTSH